MTDGQMREVESGERTVKTIRWGMIGCGSVAEVKSGPGLYKANNSVLLAVTSARPESARSYASRHGVSRVYETTEQLLADDEIDAVYIATPPLLHKPLAIQAACAGKHVYVEKPMAMRLDECCEIVEACDRRGVRLFVAFYRRAMPRFLKIKEWIDHWAIGELLSVRVTMHQRPEPDELSRETLPWRVRPDVAGAGKFLDLGIHAFDLFDFLFGPIEEVHGIAGNRVGLYEAEDTVAVTWRHACGVQGNGSWCFVCGNDEDRVEIVGSRGRIEFEFFTDKPLRLVNEAGDQQFDIPNPPHVQQPFIQSIVDDLNGIAPCPGSVESAVRSTGVVDEVLKEYRRNKAVN